MTHSHLTLRELSQIIVTETHCGRSKEDLINYLKQRGWPESAAKQFIMNVLGEEADADSIRIAQKRPNAAQEDRSRHRNLQLLWTVALIGIALITLNALGLLHIAR
jgi:hypothetical protein